MNEPDSVSAAPPPRRTLTLWAVIIALVIGAAAGGLLVLTWPQLFAQVSSRIPFAAPQNEVATAPSPQLIALEARMSVLEAQQIQSVNTEQNLDSLRYALQDLSARVAKLETEDAAPVMRNAAAIVALTDLIRLSDGGRPFSSQLELLSGLLPDAPEIKQLEPFAQSGVPTEASLAARFPSIADAALAANRQIQANGWFGRMWQRIAGLVTVRRLGNTEGDSIDSRLTRAENFMRAHDLDSALGEMRALPADARHAAEPWITDAQARVTVDRSSSAMATRLAHRLADMAAQVPP